MKILILKPSSLGDVVQALPVLRLLRRHLPASQIYWWIDSNLAPLLENDPDLTGVVGFERRRWAAPRHWPEMFRSIRWLRKQRFDWVIDLQCLARSGAFAWLADGKFLVGLDEVREGARGFYDLAVRRASFHTHAVEWYLAVLPHLGVPVHNHFAWLPERPDVAAEVKRKWLEQFRIPNSELRTPKWIAIQPGARWPNKRWPVEYFAELVRFLSRKFPGFRFAILGGEEDRPLGETIACVETQRCLNLCGQTSLLEMVEWLRLCDLMITNDTGPMHVAAALGKPLIALFGPTEPRRTGPYGQLNNVLRIDLPCSPCLKSHCTYKKRNECLNALSPAMVLQQVQKQFRL
ncbi:MAG TPA: lipopolysaccharide heptosyltransferase II [Candidatus Sulfopaludibacter sp.]|nr:lipopolysaccharide heptosyltransferase II [Candidatus Sulfopaludibacter sp.]